MFLQIKSGDRKSNLVKSTLNFRTGTYCQKFNLLMSLFKKWELHISIKLIVDRWGGIL
jgi:hypothetical protein